MKMYLISDNVDTYTGMRLAGVDGVVVHEKQELRDALETAMNDKSICHKGGFLMTTDTLEDARKACQISLDTFTDEITLVNLSSDTSTDTLLMKLPELTHVKIIHKPLPDLPALDINGIYAEVEMGKTEWKKYIKDLVKDLLKTKPEAVYVDGDMFSLYPVVHQLRKKHIPVLTSVTKDGENLLSVSHPVPDFLLSGI